MTEFVTAVVICGTIVVFSMELVKRLWKQHFEKFPSWLGICCGIWLSGMATFVYCSEWQSGYRWLLVWAGAFLFQYFVSMEIAKRVVDAVVGRIAGTRLEE